MVGAHGGLGEAHRDQLEVAARRAQVARHVHPGQAGLTAGLGGNVLALPAERPAQDGGEVGQVAVEVPRGVGLHLKFRRGRRVNLDLTGLPIMFESRQLIRCAPEQGAAVAERDARPLSGQFQRGAGGLWNAALHPGRSGSRDGGAGRRPVGVNFGRACRAGQQRPQSGGQDDRARRVTDLIGADHPAVAARFQGAGHLAQPVINLEGFQLLHQTLDHFSGIRGG